MTDIDRILLTCHTTSWLNSSNSVSGLLRLFFYVEPLFFQGENKLLGEWVYKLDMANIGNPAERSLSTVDAS